MLRFKQFKGDTALFVLDGKLVEFSKKMTQALHDTNKRQCGKKGTCPDTEQTKFALDRWPGTELAKKIAKQKRPV